MRSEPIPVQRLQVWQRSVNLALECYKLSGELPREEKFALTSQIRRAATSVPSNIAEGYGRWNARDFARFLAIASGSLRELETHLIIANRLGYLSNVSTEPTFRTIDELARMLYRMRLRVSENATRAEELGRPHNRKASQALPGS